MTQELRWCSGQYWWIYLNWIKQNLIHGEVSPEFYKLSSISLSARTALSCPPVEKTAVQGGRSAPGTVPGEMRTGCFSSLTIMKVGSNPSWHYWSLHYSFQRPSGCQNHFTAQGSTQPIVNNQRHTQTCSPLWIRDTLTTSREVFVQSRMQMGKTSGQRVGIEMQVLEIDGKI